MAWAARSPGALRLRLLLSGLCLCAAQVSCSLVRGAPSHFIPIFSPPAQPAHRTGKLAARSAGVCPARTGRTGKQPSQERWEARGLGGARGRRARPRPEHLPREAEQAGPLEDPGWERAPLRHPGPEAAGSRAAGFGDPSPEPRALLVAGPSRPCWRRRESRRAAPGLSVSSRPRRRPGAGAARAVGGGPRALAAVAVPAALRRPGVPSRPRPGRPGGERSPAAV